MTLATQHITLADGEDDWQGVYIDGKLWDQNHSLSMNDVFRKLASEGTRVCAFEVINIKDAWLIDEGGLPEYLSQIPKEARAE